MATTRIDPARWTTEVRNALTRPIISRVRATVATVLSESRRRPGRALITIALLLAVGAAPLVF